MSFALKGFITGFAKGAKERIEKEREENEAAIQNRLKMAATNRTLRQKELDAQKQLLTGRLETVSSYLPEDVTEEQKLALISNEEIAKQFVDLRSKGEKVDLNQFLVVNKDKVPQNFSTVQQYINTISTAPAPVAQERVDAIRQTRGIFGARTGANVEKMAQQFGASAAELLAYEERSGVPMVPQFARMNVNMLRNEKTKGIDDRLKDAQSMYLDALEQDGADSQAAAVAKQRYDNLLVLKDQLDPEKVKWADYVGSLKMAIVNAKTPAERQAAQREYDQAIAIERRGRDTDGEGGGKIPTANTLSNLLARSGTRAVTEQFGSQVGQNLIIEQTPDGGASFRYIGTDTAARDRITNAARQAMRFTVQPYLDMEGRPLNRDVEVALRANGIEIDGNGRAVFPSLGPRREGGAAPAQNQQRQLPRPQTQAEYAALPSGTEYIDTDGQVKRKR
jgi:hypothetical protein